MIARDLATILRNKKTRGKAIILIGARQVGKTTLIKNLLADTPYLHLNADDVTVRELLTNINTEQIKQLIGSATVVFIDEAQRIPNIGLTLKIIIDQLENVQLYITGSSALDLQSQIQEPLTGRKWEYNLFPISWQEWQNHEGYLKAIQQLEIRLQYGFYPDVVNNLGEEKEILANLQESYLLKDVFILHEIKKTTALQNLLRALAFQIGNTVNLSELSNLLNIDAKTIDRYIDILEQSFILFRLNPFSSNLRNEIKRSPKIYFYDVGIRNSIINNFSPLALRQDKGALWENFIIAEKKKQLAYHNPQARLYYWRTKQQQEVDLVEVDGPTIAGYEIKWQTKKSKKLPTTFTNTYNAKGVNINSKNFAELLKK